MLKKLRIQTQISSGENTLLYEGITHTDGKRICVREFGSNADLCIDLFDDGMRIHRLASDIETTLELRESGTFGEIRGEEGTFELTDIRFLDYRNSGGHALLRYSLGEEFLISIEELGVTNVD